MDKKIAALSKLVLATASRPNFSKRNRNQQLSNNDLPTTISNDKLQQNMPHF